MTTSGVRALNPVRAKIIDRPEDYRRSSHRATAGSKRAEEWFDFEAALGLFGGADAEGRAIYSSFGEASIGGGEGLWDKVANGIYLGTETWTKRMREQVESKPRSTDFPLKQRAVGVPKMEFRGPRPRAWTSRIPEALSHRTTSWRP